MGEYVESIRYEADIDEVKRKLRDLHGSVDATQQSHDRALGRMGRAWDGLKSTISGAVALAARAGTLIAGGLAVAGGFGLKLAGDFQQTTIAFEGILGSGEKAKTFLQQLRDFSAKTPFEFPGLATAAKNLLAVGFNTEDVIPVMTKLGNVAATLGVGEAEISGVVRALGQMKGKGKASAEELQQISEQVPGFSAIKAIADGMGISVAAAFDKVAAGAVPADAAIEHILAGMERFPGASGAMERQSKTLNGVLSTFKDTVSNIVIDFLTPYLPQISASVESVASWLGTSGAPAFQNFADAAISAGGRVVDGARAVHDWWTRNGPGITAAVGAVFGAISGWVREVAPAIRSWVSDVLGELSDWWASNGPTIVGIVRGIGAAIFGLGALVMRTVQVIVRNWDSIRTPLTVVAGIITAVLIPHWIRLGVVSVASSAKQAAAWVATQAKAVAGAAAHVAATYRVVAGWVVAGAAAVASGAQTAVIWLMYQIESVKAAAAHAASAARVVAGWVVMGASALVSAAQVALAWLIAIGPIALVIAAVVGLVALIVIHFDTIKSAVAAAWNWVRDTSSAVWRTISGAVSGAVNGIVGFVVGIKDRIAGAASTAFDGLRGGIDTVKNWIRDRITDIVGSFTGMPGRISAQVGGMWDGIKNAFRDAINWIIRGWNRLEFKVPGFDTPFGSIGGFVLGMPDIPTLHGGGVVPGGPSTEVLRLLQGGETVFTNDQMSRLGEVIAMATRGAGGGDGSRRIGQMIVQTSASPREWIDEGAWRAAG